MRCQVSYGNWEPIIGLEIHAQLSTNSKMFSADSAAFGGADNEHTSAVSLAMPGTLPVINKKALEYSIKIGLALNCEINRRSVFARKNYFYPDLPKGYQISQYDQPLCEKGSVDIYVNGVARKIGITRAHMEEDAGKSTHHGDYSLINLNRAGVPLLEIVSEPEIKNPQEAAEYARTIRNILMYLGVCDGNLEEGSIRCDCNVSVRKVGAEKFGTKVEIKNVNSFRFVEKAIEYEIQRQIAAVESGEVIVQETRLYDSTKNRTFTMRTKEEAHDYRYFPDPDLLPVAFEESWVEKIRTELPELPIEKGKRFVSEYGLPEYDALVLTQDQSLSKYFEKVAGICKNAKAASNWIMVEILRELKESDKTIEEQAISAEALAELIQLIDNNTISGKIAKSVFA
ncbi:MAG: Asp-tRNA(Asn)/Glu-tRNA(Gln) amidotransferase subunit GatB, partial [Bdellovibrionales bacterium]|nr:Asp-tRNA(Asn)/Glu-tRNA(Gln) amidotransferase subunit GatB [Bdellovibrionales bacterium]